MRELTFAEALAESEGRCRHLLLGNGFSIAASPRFAYASLFERAFGDQQTRLRSVFDRINTTDFEQVSRALSDAIAVTSCYEGSGAAIEAMTEDRASLGRLLIDVVSAIHPASAADLTLGQYRASAAFLGHFRTPGHQGNIFTTNYDLLLYWATLEHWRTLGTGDGFAGQNLLWSEANALTQSVFHLHGALHIFEGEQGRVFKVRRGDDNLMVDLRRMIEGGHMPLFVSEGTTEQKSERIAANQYLAHCLEQLSETCRSEDDALFVYGHALSDGDAHIVDCISGGTMATIYVGALDIAAAREDLAALEARWREVRRAAGGPAIELVVFPSGEAIPWG